MRESDRDTERERAVNGPCLSLTLSLLCGVTARYCASRDDQTRRKSISLVGVEPVVRSSKYKNCFEINTPLRAYVLAAESAEETQSWLQILNLQRKDANQNNHIQLAEWFTSDYESQGTSKEHACIQTCLSSLTRVLQDPQATNAFQAFLSKLPQRLQT